MKVGTKFAVVFVCAAICALSISLIPQAKKTAPTRDSTTPVLLKEKKSTPGLLV